MEQLREATPQERGADLMLSSGALLSHPVERNLGSPWRHADRSLQEGAGFMSLNKHCNDLSESRFWSIFLDTSQQQDSSAFSRFALLLTLGTPTSLHGTPHHLADIDGRMPLRGGNLMGVWLHLLISPSVCLSSFPSFTACCMEGLCRTC